MKNRIVKNKVRSNIISNNNGIALLTVILVIAILGILAAVAIETTGTDIINAGNNIVNQYTVNVSNSAADIILSQIGTNQGVDAGVGIAGMPLPGYYYYTVENPAALCSPLKLANGNQTNVEINNTYNIYMAPVPSVSNGITCQSLSSSNIIPVTNSNIVNPDNLPQNNGQIGFSYFGSYGNAKGYGNNFYFYKGQIDVISQDIINSNKPSVTAHTGMTFKYGPLNEGG
ncbi:MAG: hypothetical protein M0Z57_02765 [Deltaproteobacteria bacterium]|jgi:hypothetical protein|uniref:Type 4 fimbrial biogenesis protein PilX N-terminal domain-containing protein n=1 Tax=Candidatus Acidulodesulfobacterium acidiphilum TaxID=2597224 RepID=A0A520XGT0_9DELT|nr:hypothetical protein [Deltaproteobacteria bacterium]RZV40408.1 MAG: hypothetical protein EVJ48_00360 [Candidatus Acidulodesulfobacterium acidiphilum]